MGLERKVARLMAGKAAAETAGDKPACTFGYVVEDRLEAIRSDLSELRNMTRWLFFLVFSTFVGVVAQGLLGTLGR